MAMEATVTGSIAEPELKYTAQGKAVLEVRIGATRRAKDKQSGEWGDDGSPLWVGSTFWEKEAERLAELLTKGCKVSVSGTVVREEFQKRDGGQGEKLIIRFPRFLGYTPKSGNDPQASQDQFSGGYSPQTPTYPPNARNAPQNGAQGFGNDPAGNLANVEQQFNAQTLPPF